MSYQKPNKIKIEVTKPKNWSSVKNIKTVKTASVKIKAKSATPKAKVHYGAHKPSTSQFHDAGPETELAPPSPVGIGSAHLQQEHELAAQLLTQIADDSPDVNSLCDTYGLRREELGRLTGFSLRAMAGWASGKPPSHPAKRRLHEVRRLLDALAEIVEPESIPRWLHRPNSAFDRLTPLQVIELGEIDRLWAMVHDLRSGQPD